MVYSCSVGCRDAALACAASEKVYLFDVGQGKQKQVFKDSHTDVVNHVRFHPAESQKLLTGAEDNLVVVLDTSKTREDEAMLGVIPNEDCVRSFTLIGPDRNTLCCCSTVEDVRIWGLGDENFGSLRAQFIGLRSHQLLMRGGGDDEDFGFGYVVETFYDEPSSQAFLLAGAGNAGDLLLFRVTLAEAAPAAVFTVPAGSGMRGHEGIVRSAICLPGGRVITAGEAPTAATAASVFGASPRPVWEQGLRRSSDSSPQPIAPCAAGDGEMLRIDLDSRVACADCEGCWAVGGSCVRQKG
eukprot:s2037_g3.t1